MTHSDPGAAAYDERHRTRILANLQCRARTLGYDLAPSSEAACVS
jgi:transposase